MPCCLNNLKQARRPGCIALLLLSPLAFGLEARALPLRSAYVTNTADDTVSVISLDTNAVVGTIGVGDQPIHVAVTPDGLRAFVANRNSNNVSVIDAVSGSVIRTIDVQATPLQLTVDHTGQRVYVVNSGSNSISVINTATNSVIDTITTPSIPTAIAFHPIREEIWVGYGGPPGPMPRLEARSASNPAVVLAAAPQSPSFNYAGSGLAFRSDGSEVFGSESCGGVWPVPSYFGRLFD